MSIRTACGYRRMTSDSSRDADHFVARFSVVGVSPPNQTRMRYTVAPEWRHEATMPRRCGVE
jgi:hypothetical protein